MFDNACPGPEAKNEFTISELTREFCVTARALRFYEIKGLLHPKRRGHKRIYSRRDVARLKLILFGKRVDFTLLEIKEMLDLYDLDDGGATQRRVAVVKFHEQIQFLERQVSSKLQAIDELKESCQTIERIQRKLGEDE